MSNPSLDKFGELLMKRVRDKAIGDWERFISGEMKGATAERVQQQIVSLTPEQRDTLCNLIPLIVDTTLHHLLFTAEQERSLQLIIDNPGESAAHNLRDISDGLSGELYGKHGWIARFSKKSK
ncbi:MAG: epimerase [Verrucomicrobiota bacterium]|jgi:hypothetical protein